MLIITAGAGKTKLSSKVIDHVGSNVRAREALAYFYCDRNRTDHRDPGAVLRSLVRQLSVSDHGMSHHTYNVWWKEVEKGMPSQEPNWEVCRGLLLKLILDQKKTIIVVDGLDECDDETRYRLIQLLNGLVQHEDLLVKIFIASRNDRDLRDNYIAGPHFHIEANDNSEDIRRYVLDTLENTSITWWRDRLPQKTKDAILDIFEKKSGGM